MKIARIGQGNHKKAWKQEIRREHNSNPLQRQLHVLVVSHVFPANIPCNFNGGVMTNPYIFIIHPFWNVRAYNHDDL